MHSELSASFTMGSLNAQKFEEDRGRAVVNVSHSVSPPAKELSIETVFCATSLSSAKQLKQTRVDLLLSRSSAKI